MSIKTRAFLIIVSCCWFTVSFSQISFEKGYLINNSNEKISCYIKNLGWKNNPTKFVYKTSLEGDQLTAEILSVKEFGVENEFKFQRHTVDIDRSKDASNDLSPLQEPIFNKEQIFLKVLVQGKATLYSYQEGSLRRYFYSRNDLKLSQLIYKSYKIDEFTRAKNTDYKKQLWVDVKCGIDKYSVVNQLEYKKRDLIGYFVDYNTCNNMSFVNYEQNKKSNGTFNISIRPGLNSSSLDYRHASVSSFKVNYDNELSLRFGIEFEYVLPFNKNKWSFIVEPTYQYFKSEVNANVKVDYSSIEIPMGMRHYMYLNEDSKLFVNAQVVLDFPRDSKLYYAQNRSLLLSSKPNMALGLGYKYNDTYSIELRGHTNRNVLDGFTPNWKSAYKTMSLVIGYSIL